MIIGIILYDADTINDNKVNVYQPKPPEESESSHFLCPFYKSLWGIGFAKIFLGTI